MKLRIFVIDDEENIRDTFKWHLEGLGHEVITLPDPSFCAAYVGRQCRVEYTCADILIIDYCMPKMNGLSFLELLEKNGCLNSVRFKMILSGNTDQFDVEHAKKLGCEVRQKPMTILDLEEWVKPLANQVPKNRKLDDLTFMDFV